MCWSNTVKVPLYQPSSSSESHWSQRWRQLDKISPDLKSQPPQSEKRRQSERHLAQHDEIGMDRSGWWNKKESKQVLFPAFLALTSLAGSIIPDTSHPDPVPLVNVQLWETRAYKFWRFFESFFWDYTFHIRSQEITYALLKFQGSIWGVIRSEIFTNAIIYQSVNLSLSLY